MALGRLRGALLRLAPPSLRRWLRYLANRRHRQGFRGQPRAAVFSRIYAQGHWGMATDGEAGFNSGTGSHDEAVVGPYVAAVGAFLDGLPEPPDAVDLGCGDFAVGAHLRGRCRGYVACDIVPALVDWNRERHAAAGVDFRTLDLVDDELPAGEVAFVRQVLQHLGNAEIARLLPKLAAAYRFAIVTEHLPAAAGFVANRDKPAGPDTRLDLPGRPSGVVLTAPPFGLAPVEQRILCEVASGGGVIRTVLYRLR